MYISRLLYSERKQLCYILDQNNKWEELGLYMKYDVPRLEKIREAIDKGRSPSCALLTLWGLQNHTVLELFGLLECMKLYQAMNVIKHLVEEKYHALIRDDDNMNTFLFEGAANMKVTKLINFIKSHISPENFNGHNEKIFNDNNIYIVISKDGKESIIHNIPKPLSKLPKSKMTRASHICWLVESARGTPSIPYKELEKSTNNWDENLLLGRGGYGKVFKERKQLCCILDQSNKWEELGGVYMKYDVPTLETIRRVIYRGSSPSCELLTLWGLQNHTVLELFGLLERMKLYQAMTVIKHLVDEKYHGLIRDGEDNIDTILLERAVNMRERKLINIMDSHISPENFIGDNEKIFNDVKVILQPTVMSRDTNESIVDDKLKPLPKLPLAKSKMLTGSHLSCVVESAGGTPSIPYEELEKSTNNWDENFVLGRGGFGKVFKGTWKCTPIAIKRLEQRKQKHNLECDTEEIQQSITEIRCLNSYRQDNILPLYGYSIGGAHPCLIYQYMPGGSLEQRLRVRDPQKMLDWPKRLNIAIGTARGLQFLHTNMINGKPLIHGDIKSANILLDSNNEPRIGDFGLAREGPQSQYTYIKVSRIHGTRPYLPEEFLRGNKFSTKVDNYSFGVVLFEIATAQPAYAEKREKKFLKDYVIKYKGDIMDLKDTRVEGYDEYFKGMMEIGKMCVRDLAKERPESRSVFIWLEQVRDGTFTGGTIIDHRD